MVDHGPEFGSVYFEALLSQCFVTKINRPPKPQHFGSVIERIFGTTTSEFLNQLRGNTQASKMPRQMKREVDPKQLAIWTLERFAARLTEYVYEVYDVSEARVSSVNQPAKATRSHCQTRHTRHVPPHRPAKVPRPPDRFCY